jgi:nitroreductase
MPDIHSLTTQLSQESRSYPCAQPRPIWVRPDVWATPDMARISLPDALTESRPFCDVLRERQAVRRYNPLPIDRRALGTLLRAAEHGDGVDWPREQYDARLQYLIVAWRVADTPPAIYLYEPGAHSLARLASAPCPDVEGPDLVLQPEFARASAIVLIIGALATALAQHGSRGHQMLLLRAGAAAQRMWLASIAGGLEGTVFAGFLPRATQRLTGVDGFRRAALFAYAMGVADMGHGQGSIPKPVDSLVSQLRSRE